MIAPVLTGFTQTAVPLNTPYSVELVGESGSAIATQSGSGTSFEMDFGTNGVVEVYSENDGSSFNFSQKLSFTFPASSGVPSEFAGGADFIREVLITDSAFSESTYHVKSVAYQFVYFPNASDPQYWMAFLISITM